MKSLVWARLRAAALLCLTFLLFVGSVRAAGATAAPGWTRVEIPTTGSYFLLYVPAGLDTTQPVPVILFFHGSGGTPDLYKIYVQSAADKAHCVLALPKSASDLGWGTGNDEQTVTETLRLVHGQVTVDDQRVALAGHSAGGAWAYLEAYAASTYSAVFTLSASYYPVTALADPTYTPPIRMYYGTLDQNYALARPNLEAQWARLGVPVEEDVQPGYYHDYWPDTSMLNGFLFAVSKSRPAPFPVEPPTPPTTPATCTPTATNLCLSQGRFRAEVAFDANGASGMGQTVPGGSADSGLFWFFSADNWEVMVKVLNGCDVNHHYWIYSAATTDVHYVLTVTDTLTGAVKKYENPAGKAAAAITDSSAFQTCP
jgi:acetyl esterase/lipase